VAPPATNGLGGLSVPPIPIAPAGAGGANPIQNDFGTNSGVVQPDVPALNKSINPRMMKVGGVVKKKYAKGGVVDDEDEDDLPKKKSQKKR
jgi:hypothetical protein